MKTERRHELQTNALAEWITVTSEAIKPYSRAIVGTILALVVVAVLFTYLSARQNRQQSAGWDDYLRAIQTGNPSDLREIAENYSGTPPGNWAQVAVGDSLLADGVDQLYKDRATARDQLNKAVESYTQVLQQADEPMLEQKATFGLARANESLNELDRARANYKKLADWPNGIYAEFANQRLEDLNKTSTKEFYDWFARQEPKPPPITGPEALKRPGQRPAFDFGELPTAPDMGMPRRPDPFNQPSPGDLPDLPRPENSPTTEPPPASETKLSDTAAESAQTDKQDAEKPADEAKPAP